MQRRSEAQHRHRIPIGRRLRQQIGSPDWIALSFGRLVHQQLGVRSMHGIAIERLATAQRAAINRFVEETNKDAKPFV